MRVLVAPDKFKFSLTALEAAEAIAAGVREASSAAEVVAVPMSDGGEGAGELLAQSAAARTMTATVHDALGRQRRAQWWYESTCRRAVVESAEACGLQHIAPASRDVLRATSYGVGELIQAAAGAGASEVVVCVGGTASVDGGAGALQALGYELLDPSGAKIENPAGGGALPGVRAIRPPAPGCAARVLVLVDVENPLLGETGAARTFGPQKGASPQQVELLDAALAAWADLLEHSTGRFVRSEMGSGAGGGIPFALAAALSARITPGLDYIADAVGFDAALAGCGLCITGEGRLDEQTARGKTVAGVARRAAALGVPCVAVVGAFDGVNRTAAARALGLRDIVIATPPGVAEPVALRDASANVRRATVEYLRRALPAA